MPPLTPFLILPTYIVAGVASPRSPSPSSRTPSGVQRTQRESRKPVGRDLNTRRPAASATTVPRRCWDESTVLCRGSGLNKHRYRPRTRLLAPSLLIDHDAFFVTIPVLIDQRYKNANTQAPSRRGFTGRLRRWARKQRCLGLTMMRSVGAVQPRIGALGPVASTKLVSLASPGCEVACCRMQPPGPVICQALNCARLWSRPRHSISGPSQQGKGGQRGPLHLFPLSSRYLPVKKASFVPVLVTKKRPLLSRFGQRKRPLSRFGQKMRVKQGQNPSV
ncbi:hypothetical protein EV126DRAFT_191838 [Verticillium dahliae]|nr:hypothetical protein EV126DRAFT_191838 [Verticillium dahliae]